MVFGGDDRQLVQNTLVYPNRAICYLRVYFGTEIFCGTGFLVGERALVTAAHCVHDDHFANVGKATRIEIIPAGYLDAKRQLIAPYGFAELDYSACRVPQEWIQNTTEQALSHDYALIRLPSTHAFGKKLGYFGLTPIGPELDPTLLQYPSYYLYGYPVNSPPPGWLPGMPGWAAGPLQSFQGNRVNYLIDMTPGQSGGPLFYQYGAEADGTPKVGVLAINHYESMVSNTAVVIRPAIYDRLISWKNETHESPTT
jgi:V8-like Glu-specific endopeptidase